MTTDWSSFCPRCPARANFFLGSELSLSEVETLRKQIDTLERKVEARDRMIAAKSEEISRLKAGR